MRLAIQAAERAALGLGQGARSPLPGASAGGAGGGDGRATVGGKDSGDRAGALAASPGAAARALTKGSAGAHPHGSPGGRRESALSAHWLSRPAADSGSRCSSSLSGEGDDDGLSCDHNDEPSELTHGASSLLGEGFGGGDGGVRRVGGCASRGNGGGSGTPKWRRGEKRRDKTIPRLTSGEVEIDSDYEEPDAPLGADKPISASAARTAAWHQHLCAIHCAEKKRQTVAAADALKAADAATSDAHRRGGAPALAAAAAAVAAAVAAAAAAAVAGSFDGVPPSTTTAAAATSKPVAARSAAENAALLVKLRNALARLRHSVAGALTTTLSTAESSTSTVAAANARPPSNNYDDESAAKIARRVVRCANSSRCCGLVCASHVLRRSPRSRVHASRRRRSLPGPVGRLPKRARYCRSHALDSRYVERVGQRDGAEAVAAIEPARLQWMRGTDSITFRAVPLLREAPAERDGSGPVTRRTG